MAVGAFGVADCGGSSSTATSPAADAVGHAVTALNDPATGLRAAWAESVSGTAANLAAPSVLLAPGYTCELIVTDAGVSLFLQEPGGSLPTEFDWTAKGGVVQQPSVPASAPEGGTPCILSDSWVVALT